jgi:hypothetical protein
MPGLADKATFSRIVYPAEEFTLRKLFFSEGLGVQFIMFIVPGTLLPLITCSFFKKKFKEFGKYFLFFLVPTLMAYLYFFVMQGFWVRFLFPYLALGLIAMVILLDKFKWGRRYFWLFGCVSIFTSVAEISKRGQLLASLLISILLFILFKSSKNFRIPKLLKNKKTGIAILLIIILSLIAVKIESDYNRDVFNKYPHMFSRKERKEADTALGWPWLDENTAGGEKIAYTGRCESYPLFGSHFKNDVFYISINNKPPLPHCYLRGDYRKEKDVLAWKQNLQDKKIDYLFVYQPYNRSDYPIEDEWARADKGMFNLVYENLRVRIYKLKIK